MCNSTLDCALMWLYCGVTVAALIALFVIGFLHNRVLRQAERFEYYKILQKHAELWQTKEK